MATQKLSVQKALRRKFRRFLSAKADFNGLVLLKLQVGARVLPVAACLPACQGPFGAAALCRHAVPAGQHCWAPWRRRAEHAAPRAKLHGLQECLRDARRVEAITGQQDDRDNYVVPVR